MATYNGIVLRKIKFGDSGVVVKLLTKEQGIISVVVRSGRNKGRTSFVFQSGNQIQLEATKKATSDIFSAKEYSVANSYKEIGIDIPKTSITTFICEVINCCVSQNQNEEFVHDFVSKELLSLDERNDRPSINLFHINFMIGLTSFLGFAIQPHYKPGMVFSPEKGAFEFGNTDISEKEVSKFLSLLINNNHPEEIPRKVRNKLLSLLLKFYEHHIPETKNLKSINVLKEIST